MEDKMLMEGLLWDTKVMADLCLHGSIESSTKGVHEMFLLALKDMLEEQNEIYNLMSDQGWYTLCEVEPEKIEKAREKFQTLQEGEN